ncbi:cis-prenyltransferase 4, chloroplastic-like [Miscanthus floridulus]|uniref:cis-prenyltransferase 4, chloroplastic-like n=1 Tax=Miscanthus floridulus TaxID=154761 RepID=UPI003459FE9B
MLSRFLSVTARRTRHQARRLHAGAGAVVAPPPQALVQSGIRPESLPRHVAVVTDGNRRWAKARGMLTAEGHEAGRRALEHTIGLSHAWGIRALTVFAFSQENFGRPKMEVDYLMGMIERTIRDNIDEYARNGIRMHVIGDPSRRPASLQNAAREAEEMTRNNSKFHLMLATCYSGRWDIVQACRELAGEVQGKTLRPEDIDESLLASKLATGVAGEFSCPDLVIRTSGEVRLSNFLMWQSAYSELYFTDVMWPDFGETEYLQALSSFQSRERRFGQRNA